MRIQTGEKGLHLPKSALQSIAYHLDEPTRTNAALAFKDFADVVPAARRNLSLPTRLELMTCGCRNPDFAKVLRTFKPVDQDTSPEMKRLQQHYQKGAALQAATRHGVAASFWGAPGTYTGGYRNGRREGFGFWDSDGHRYEGEFKNHQQHGHGVCLSNNNSGYEGEHKHGKMHGRGVYCWMNGDRYEGDFQDDKPNGQGIFSRANGERYEGEFKDGKKHGQGRLLQANGNRYEGAFEHNKPITQSELSAAAKVDPPSRLMKYLFTRKPTI